MCQGKSNNSETSRSALFNGCLWTFWPFNLISGVSLKMKRFPLLIFPAWPWRSSTGQNSVPSYFSVILCGLKIMDNYCFCSHFLSVQPVFYNHGIESYFHTFLTLIWDNGPIVLGLNWLKKKGFSHSESPAPCQPAEQKWIPAGVLWDLHCKHNE